MSSVSVKMSMMQQECLTRMVCNVSCSENGDVSRECQCFMQRECQCFSNNVNVSAITSMSQWECQRLSENVSVNGYKKTNAPNASNSNSKS